MPVTDPNCPASLRAALERMESLVQSFKKSLPFTAPEMMDMRYIDLQNGLADAMVDLHNAKE